MVADPDLARRLVDLHVGFEDDPADPNIEAELDCALSALVDRHGRPCVETAPDPRPEVKAARRFLRERLADSVCLDDVAAVAGYSPFYFLRMFRDAVGLTPAAFLLQARIDRATELLEEGVPLSHTAHDCGFADQSHMTRRFKQVLGVTPGQFARSRVRLRAA